MLFKMLGIERAFQIRRDTMQKPRQIFVTQSRVLAGKVEEYFNKLLESLSASGKSPKELARIMNQKKLQQEDGGLFVMDDENDWRTDLPKKFSLLEDSHFPLFLTFDRVGVPVMVCMRLS